MLCIYKDTILNQFLLFYLEMAYFGDNFDDTEVDPAAEFLAREQDQLAGLEDELRPAAATLTNGKFLSQKL